MSEGEISIGGNVRSQRGEMYLLRCTASSSTNLVDCRRSMHKVHYTHWSLWRKNCVDWMNKKWLPWQNPSCDCNPIIQPSSTPTRLPILKIRQRLVAYSEITGLKPVVTRSSASYQLKFCQLPRNGAETTCTTSPEEIEVMKLEGYSGPMCNKHVHSTMTRSSCFHYPIGVINKPTTDELWISPVYRRLAVAKFSKSTM